MGIPILAKLPLCDTAVPNDLHCICGRKNSYWRSPSHGVSPSNHCGAIWACSNKITGKSSSSLTPLSGMLAWATGCRILGWNKSILFIRSRGFVSPSEERFFKVLIKTFASFWHVKVSVPKLSCRNFSLCHSRACQSIYISALGVDQGYFFPVTSNSSKAIQVKIKVT